MHGQKMKSESASFWRRHRPHSNVQAGRSDVSRRDGDVTELPTSDDRCEVDFCPIVKTKTSTFGQDD